MYDELDIVVTKLDDMSKIISTVNKLAVNGIKNLKIFLAEVASPFVSVTEE